MSETWIIVLVVILYVIQAFAGGMIARSRGKTFWFWFAVCFLNIFPMGWVFMLIYTRDGNDLIP